MAVDPELLKLRNQIDAIDDQILDLLNQRARCAQHVAEIKQATGEVECFYRPEREAEVLRRVAQQNPGPLSKEAVVRFFREVMSECLALEKPLTVAFLGPVGTFAEQAAYKHFGHAIQSNPETTIDDVFKSVETGCCQFGVAPVENSTEGVIARTLDRFVNSSLLIVGEVVLDIHHNLMGQTADLASITQVFSHQQSLGQCRQWLDSHLPHAERLSVNSNAEAARLASVTPNSAAIAGVQAAELYKLNILAHNIEDEANNATRFWVIGKIPVGPTGKDKTSLLINTRNYPGALYQALEPFARHKISMSKIESRPSRRGAWNYFFFIDVEGHRLDPELESALNLLEKDVILTVLGSYPRAID